MGVVRCFHLLFLLDFGKKVQGWGQSLGYSVLVADFDGALAPEAAAQMLLDTALEQAGKGTWERIAVGQIHYLNGDKERAEEIFASIKKKEDADWMRIGRVYYRAGDWEKAKEAFDTVMRMAPKDEDWIAEIGAYYNLQGDREKAEELFDRSFGMDPDNLYNTLKAAGSYIGIEER